MHDFKIGTWSLGQQARGLVLESFSKVDFMSVLRFSPCLVGMCFVMVVEYVGPLDEGEVFRADLVGTAAL